MKKLSRFYVIALFAFTLSNVVAQNEWEPEFFTTGYVVTQFEYGDIQNFDERDRYALGLSEAAFSASYLPLENLEIKGTFLYRPGVETVESAIVEAYSTWKFSEKFKVGLGRYLTPMSPTNHYFYAPLNNSSTLPLLINHHLLFPQSFDGVKISGETGSSIKFGYTGIVGEYSTVGHSTTDLLEFQGQGEFVASIGAIESVDYRALGMAVRASLNVNDVFKLGANYFFGNSITPFPNADDRSITDQLDSKQSTVGVDVFVELGKLNLRSEYWYGEKHTNKGGADDYAFYNEGFYTEASLNMGKLTPFVKYDYLDDMPQIPINKYTAGVSFRPIFQTLFKAEYGYYAFNTSSSFKEMLTSVDFQDNVNLIILSAVISF